MKSLSQVAKGGASITMKKPVSKHYDSQRAVYTTITHISHFSGA